MQSFSITAGSIFSGHVWLNSGALFRNPAVLELEMVTSGPFEVRVYNPGADLSSLPVGEAYRANPEGGWHTFHFRQGGEFGAGLPDGDYKILLVSHLPENLDRHQIRSGRLVYDV